MPLCRTLANFAFAVKRAWRRPRLHNSVTASSGKERGFPALEGKMIDTISARRRSEIMSRIRSKDTLPEMLVRRMVHAMGYRYRLHRKDLPGRPDMTFARLGRIIQVHGCFWHQHDDPDCPANRRPKSNRGYWNAKLDRNQVRDAENYSALRQLGWQVLVVWECQLKDTAALSARLEAFLSAPPPPRRR